MEQIIGKNHYLYINDIDDITGRFTSLQADKIFGIGDEISFSGAIRSNNIIKSKITQGYQKLEKKGHDPVMVDIFLNLVFLSNCDSSVRVENTDRRYFVKRVSDIHRGDHVYFSRLANCLNQDTANHFYTYLMQMNISEFNPREVPETEEKNDMKAYAMSSTDLFVNEILSGEIVYKISYLDPAENEYFQPGMTYDYTMNKLWDQFHTFCKSGKAGRTDCNITKMTFCKDIRKKLVIANKSKDRHDGIKINLSIIRA